MKLTRDELSKPHVPVSSKVSMDLPAKVAVFTETNLGTRIAVAVTPDTPAGDLKREIGKEHQTCFPDFGEIKVNALMVKRKSCFYHLPDFVPIRNAFQGLNGSWYLHAHTSPGNKSDQPFPLQALVAKLSDPFDNGSNRSNLKGSQIHEEHIKLECDSMIKKSRKRRKIFQQPDESLKKLPSYCNTRKGKNKNLKEKQSNILEGKDGGFLVTVDSRGFPSMFGHIGANEVDCKEDDCSSWKIVEDTQSQSMSEVVSVTGIITKYFSPLDEVDQFDQPSMSGGFNDSVVCEADKIYFDETLKSKTDEACAKLQVGTKLTYAPKTPSRKFFLSPYDKRSPGT